MQFWLFLFGAVACVALSGATPVGEVKETSEETLDHHEIHKRQLEVVNAASGLSECMIKKYCKAEHGSLLATIVLFFVLFFSL